MNLKDTIKNFNDGKISFKQALQQTENLWLENRGTDLALQCAIFLSQLKDLNLEELKKYSMFYNCI